MTDTLQPLIKNIEAEFNMKLIAESLVTKLKIKFSVQDYYETDLTSKANYYQKMLQVGALTVNDIRMKEGLEPIENGWKPLVSANLKSLDSDFVDGNLGAGDEGND
jgi:phage portal protein BeeE